MNSGRIQITLKPLEERKGVAALDVIRRLEPKLRDVPGIRLYLQPVQDLTVEDRISRTQYQYAIDAPDKALLDEWVPRLVSRMQQLPELRDVATDQQNNGVGILLNIDRDTAGRLGITPQNIDDTLYDAFGQRQVSTIYTQTNQFRVVLEVAPQFKTDSSAFSRLFVPIGSASANLANTIALAGTNSALTGAAALAPAPAAIAHHAAVDIRADRREPPGPVPGGDALLQPGAGLLAWRGGRANPEDDEGTRHASKH